MFFSFPNPVCKCVAKNNGIIGYSYAYIDGFYIMKLYVMMIFTAHPSEKLSGEAHFYLEGFSVRVTVTLFFPKMFFNSVSDMFLILPSLVKFHEFVS